jgi:hypothetical protein
MAPKPKLLISSGSKKKEPRYICLSEAKASHSHKMWAEVSSLTSHFLRKGLSSSPSRWRCLLRMLWPVSRPVTALDWILLKVKNFALVPRLGPEISSRACFWVFPRPCHWASCWLTNQRRSLFCKSRLETPSAGLGPRNPRAEPPLEQYSDTMYAICYTVIFPLRNGMSSVKFIASQARSIYQYKKLKLRYRKPQCNLLHTLRHYIDYVVYWRYIMYYTIHIIRFMSPRKIFCNLF